MTHNSKYHFRVGWKLTDAKKGGVADYQAASLKDLLQMLERSEGISIRTTTYLYIHQVIPTGGIKEVLAHDEKTGAIQVDFSRDGGVQPGSADLREEHKVVTKVGELLARASELNKSDNKGKKQKKEKPRIKLKQSDVPTKSSFFYTAYEAGHNN